MSPRVIKINKIAWTQYITSSWNIDMMWSVNQMTHMMLLTNYQMGSNWVYIILTLLALCVQIVVLLVS